jgi:hypothetical protein
LFILTPPGSFEDFILATSEPASSLTLPPPSEPPTEEELEQLGALAAQHGMEIVG